MLSAIGFLVVIVAVVLGYMYHGGSLALLWQPSEIIIILGAAIGAFLASSTRYSFKQVRQNLPQIFRPKAITKAHYEQTLALLYTLFTKMHREGIISIEQDIENPDESPLFQSFEPVNNDTQVCAFIGDTLRTYLTTGKSDELGELMDADIRSIKEELEVAPHSMNRLADSLPGMGIVAAVLGIVLTMDKISLPPAELGKLIGAALLGTFLGILFCYGFFSPMAAKLENLERERSIYFRCVREAVMGALRGLSPIIAMEYGRRSIPPEYRPSFAEMEEALKTAGATPPGEPQVEVV
ncbi:flagellar motor stator protein MotA [Desulfovibrio sp. OttesenSCG-928-F07]|nr:flagellar motor stator protein MotA [Desulfovibrio sp. OttesenSCG-928-F07]